MDRRFGNPLPARDPFTQALLAVARRGGPKAPKTDVAAEKHLKKAKKTVKKAHKPKTKAKRTVVPAKKTKVNKKRPKTFTFPWQ